MPLGSNVSVGGMEGTSLGSKVAVGAAEGIPLGSNVTVGKLVGAPEGIPLGSNVAVGTADGAKVVVGSLDTVGSMEGSEDGAQVELFPTFPPYPSCLQDLDLDLDFDLEELEVDCFPACRYSSNSTTWARRNTSFWGMAFVSA